MELTEKEISNLKKIIGEWVDHPKDYELEASFGGNRGLENAEFMSVLKRLRARYGDPYMEDTRLTITLKDASRFTIKDKDKIHEYCTTNQILGQKFVAIKKNSVGNDNDMGLPNYDVFVKTRKESPMNDSQIQTAVKNWEKQYKAFRLINRWSFQDKQENPNVHIDVSVVYSTKMVYNDRTKRHEYAWSFNYPDLKQEVPSYEVEVELVHSEANKEQAHALKVFIGSMGEVLRGIQKSPVLIRKRVKEGVKAGYLELTGTKEFIGSAPRTLLYNNFVKHEYQEKDEPTLYDGYNVTDKADGLRVLAYTDNEGELFLMDMSINQNSGRDKGSGGGVYQTGLKNPTCRNSLLDGEWVTSDKTGNPIQQLCLFDVFFINKDDKSQKIFYDISDPNDLNNPTRHTLLEKWVTDWNNDSLVGKRKGGLSVSKKNFYFANPYTDEIFTLAAKMLDDTKDPQYPYYTDGLIFTPNELPLPSRRGEVFNEQFKWKPSADNSIDFLIVADIDPKTGDEIIEVKEDSVRYKKYTLCVKQQVDPKLNDPRDTVLNKRGIPESLVNKNARLPYRRVPFQPNEFTDPMASQCYIEVNDQGIAMTENNEPIRSNIIVEMRYDMSEPRLGFQWKPMRIRHDKTARYEAALKESKQGTVQLGKRTINAFISAMDVWVSINDPITEEMIKTGKQENSVAEQVKIVASGEPSINRYYQNRLQKRNRRLISTMTNFHNFYIKERVLLGPSIKASGSKTLIDLSVGQGSDIGRWYRSGIKFAFGVDKAEFGIVDKENGAYRRYLKTVADNFNEYQRKEFLYKKFGSKGEPPKPRPMPPMLFAVGDSGVNIPTGKSAGDSKLDATIMKAVFGNGVAEDAPPFVKENAAALKDGAGVTAMMFSLHYMFQNKEIFDGFLENLNACVQIGGYFVGCCFDGETVFNKLKEKGDERMLERSIERNDGVKVNIWSIERKYENAELGEEDENVFGQAIDVSFISIGTPYTEYLVPFNYLEKRLASIGLRLLNQAELKELGLQHSTNMFSESWNMAKDLKGKDDDPVYPAMAPVVEEYSFLNRWFIFKRESTEAVKQAMKEGASVDLSAMQGLKVAGTQEGGGDAVPVVLPGGKKEYEINDVFQFHMEAPLTDRFKLGDKSAARWLAPIARFPIEDDDGYSYPTLDHYMAAMRYKHGATKKDGSPVDNNFIHSLFGQDGSIHQRALRAEIRERGENNITDEQLKVIVKQESDEIQKQLKTTGLKSHGLVANDAAWSEVRDDLLHKGLRQRWEKDERFRKIVNELGKQNKYLLYYSPSVGMSYYAGMRKANKTIEGENMVGRILMQLANFPNK
jgi:hypothetical protein